MEYEKIIEINKRAHKIINSDLSWKDKYDMIFSDDIYNNVPTFEYYDPDCDYDDDVLAWMNGFDDYMKKAKIINEQING